MSEHTTIRVRAATKKRFNEVWKELCNYGESGDDLINRLMDYYYSNRKKKKGEK